jgi:hypothetical protein
MPHPNFVSFMSFMRTNQDLNSWCCFDAVTTPLDDAAAGLNDNGYIFFASVASNSTGNSWAQ